MSSFELDPNYWTNYWTHNPIIEHEDPQCQVGRTVHRIPISQEKWQFHLSEIERLLQLKPEDTLLDLCAGNGLISMPLSLKCRAVTAVDISPTLLGKIKTDLYPSVTVITADARNVALPAAGFSKGLMYGALQYFSERETIGILENIHQCLISGGVFLIGDIPDIDQLFGFYNKPEWVKSYFESVKAGTPAIGTWFKRDLLDEMAKFAGFSDTKVLSQHPDLINSHYRFDLVLTK